MFLGLRLLFEAPVEPAEAEVGMGDQRAHAELVGERESLAKMVLGRGQLRGIAAGGDLAEKV